MNTMLKIVHFLRDPHSKKIQLHKERYQELDELAKVAVDINDPEAYKSLQAEMREVFFDYLTSLGMDAIYKFSPHLILACLISLKFRTIMIPLFNWQVNTVFAYLCLYFLFHFLLKPVIGLIKTKMTNAEQAGIQVDTKITAGGN